jgi:hypothetical protein
MLQLIVQAAHRAPAGARVIILVKNVVNAQGRELVAMVALEEKSAIIVKDFRLKKQNAGYCGFDLFHCRSPCV